MLTNLMSSFQIQTYPVSRSLSAPGAYQEVQPQRVSPGQAMVPGVVVTQQPPFSQHQSLGQVVTHGAQAVGASHDEKQVSYLFDL